MILLENIVYWLQFGPMRRAFRFLARRFLARGDRVLLGPARGCTIVRPDLPYRLGVYELHVQRALCRVLHPASVFYDVGANVGFFSLLGAKLVGKRGVVIAFEPSADSGLAIQSLCAANGVGNVQLISEAVAAVDGDAYFTKGPNLAQGRLTDGLESGGLKVRTLSLDSFTRTYPPPQVVLMDIEGAESDALCGARHLLSLPTAPTWIIEVHNGDTDKRVRQILTESGYELTTLVPIVARARRYPIHLLASKSSAEPAEPSISAFH